MVTAEPTRGRRSAWLPPGPCEGPYPSDMAREPQEDAALRARAAALSTHYLGGHARPNSVRWVDTMQGRWGSCTPSAGTIRLSRRLQSMPGHVRDYVLLHELTHLLVPGHGPNFWTLLGSYPHVERARRYLDAVTAAAAAPGSVERSEAEVATGG